jgi:hypothetical protein
MKRLRLRYGVFYRKGNRFVETLIMLTNEKMVHFIGLISAFRQSKPSICLYRSWLTMKIFRIT